MDYIFKIGLYLLPFENLVIAPSMGWAAITPIIFFIYVLFNFRLAIKSVYKYRYIFAFFLVGFLMSLMNYIFIDVGMKNFVNAVISLGLGITNLLSMDIYFRQKNNEVDKDIKILTIVYIISLLIGWIQFLTIKFDIQILKQFFIIIEKRSYIKVSRVQFTFTEPSFIGMHLFGILLPLYLYTKKKNICTIIIAFCISSIMFSSGVRILVDIIIVAIILYIIFFIKNIKNVKVVALTFVAIIIGVIGIKILYDTNNRVKNIIDDGIYADASLATRVFRINATLKGCIHDSKLLIGYGLGNAIVPLQSGYGEALQEYDNLYITEVNQLAGTVSNDNVSFCMYTRIISEFGIVLLIVAIVYLYVLSIKSDNYFLKNYIWILLYLYIQFDSYAFYTIWLYIVLLDLDIEKSKKNVIRK